MKERKPYDPDRHAHPGLAAIALLEAGKAALAFLAAAGLEISGPAPLRNIVNTLIRRIGSDPEHGSFSKLLDLITPDTVHVVAGHYLGYFRSRPDSIIGALRAVAGSPGAAIINCAAGKDRTGTVSAVLLAALGVPEDQILADYAASTERIVAILTKLGFMAGAGSGEHDADVQSQSTPPELMELVLRRVARDFGSVAGWLELNGWTADDQAGLEAKLLG